ncbi:MAG: prepilin peptidase [Eggerthellaceae bacterium]|nr:prepilin peptidase [Eggerthellaceae bacterium]
MALTDPIVTAYVLVVTAIFGLVMGSFINCWAWRFTHGESVLKGRSHCATCNHELGARDLVPVFSWLASGRKCRYCGEPVSARYPATEVICALVFVLIVAKYGLTLEALELIVFAGVLLFLSLTDLDERIIPNGCIVVALVVRAAYLAIALAMGWMNSGQVLYYVVSAFAVGIALLVIVLIADKVFGRESMGGGDLKLYFVAGFYFGWQQCLFLVILSCVIGIVVALVGAGKAADEGEDSEGTLHRAIPFGPSIAVACVITMLVGDSFISWYLSLLG